MTADELISRAESYTQQKHRIEQLERSLAALEGKMPDWQLTDGKYCWVNVTDHFARSTIAEHIKLGRAWLAAEAEAMGIDQ